MGVNWKGLLGGVAPTLVKALGLGGGPAGAAVAVLSRALLGHDRGDEGTVAAALEAGLTPEQAGKLAEAEHDFALKLVDSAVALERLENEDRQSARAREVAVRDHMPAILAIVLSVMVAALLAMLAFVRIPPENREPFMMLLGSVGTAWIGAMTYYHGTSSSSRAKDAVIGKMAAAR